MLKSSMHKNKQIVTVGEFVTMVQDQNWKKDVSYVLVEQLNEKDNSWNEYTLQSVAEIRPNTLRYISENEYLEWEDQEVYAEVSNVRESALMQELVDRDGGAYRYTVYMT